MSARPGPRPDEFQHGFAELPGLRMHYAEAGRGTPVLLCHGFPESWYSWRHQLKALAEHGYRAIAPDQRGYGQTDAPEAVEAYSQPILVGDLVALLDALEIEQAIAVGHDWGSPIAWNAALVRPDRFPAVVGVSVPYFPVSPVRPTEMLKALWTERFYYVLYFQQRGLAEAELEADVRTALRRFFYTLSAEIPPDEFRWDSLPRASRFMDQLGVPKAPLGWLSEAEFDYFVGEWERRGFTHAIDWYRCIDSGWEQLRAFAGRVPEVPAAFLHAERDYPPTSKEALELMATTLPKWRGSARIEGAGHWLQQEQPERFNRALLGFLDGFRSELGLGRG